MDQDKFQKSDVGAQAAWKGFFSQTLYIASRLISDEQGYEYYPEDIEDLIIKKEGIVVEAVQIKNISADLTISSLALTKTSKSGEGYRKGFDYFEDTLAKAVSETKGTLVKTEHYAYIIVDCNVSQGETLESEYLNTVLRIRSAFSDAVMLSSDRWYVETQSLKLAYIPVILGAYFPVAFMIPFYKVFDVDESQITDTMFPCEIEQGLEGRISSEKMHNSWIEAMQKISTMKLYLQCYEQVLQVPAQNECLDSVTAFTASILQHVEALRKELGPCETLIRELMEEPEEQINELLKVMKLFFDSFDDIKKYIIDGGNMNEIIQVINSITGVMILLQPYVIEHLCSEDI